MYRFVICVDVAADDLKHGYSKVYHAMSTVCESGLEWESSDEAFDENGESIDPDVIQAARMAFFKEDGNV